MALGERIRERLAEIHESQASLARSVGVSPQAISKLVNGETVDTSKLYQIARFLDTTPEYLLGETDLVENTYMSDTRLPLRSAPLARDPDLVELEEIDLRYGMGGTYLDSPVNVERRQFSRAWLRNFTHTAPEHLFWAVGDGDSMEPVIRSGEIVLIDASQTTARMAGGIWAVTLGEFGMIKRLHSPAKGRLQLLSENRNIPPIDVADDELHLVGRVVAVVRRL